MMRLHSRLSSPADTISSRASTTRVRATAPCKRALSAAVREQKRSSLKNQLRNIASHGLPPGDQWPASTKTNAPPKIRRLRGLNPVPASEPQRLNSAASHLVEQIQVAEFRIFSEFLEE